jgi:transcription factor TGA
MATWHNKQINELKAAVNARASDDDLQCIIDSIMAHYYEAFRLNDVAANADAILVPSGMWKTPVERCFMKGFPVSF